MVPIAATAFILTHPLPLEALSRADTGISEGLRTASRSKKGHRVIPLPGQCELQVLLICPVPPHPAVQQHPRALAPASASGPHGCERCHEGNRERRSIRRALARRVFAFLYGLLEKVVFSRSSLSRPSMKRPWCVAPPSGEELRSFSPHRRGALGVFRLGIGVSWET